MKTLKSVILIALTTLVSCQNANKKDEIEINSNNEDAILNKDKEIAMIKYYKLNQLQSISFFQNGQVSKIVKYVKSNNEIQPNQFININENGDTVKSESLYYLIFYDYDTIILGDNYPFKIVLEGHILDSARLLLCDYGADFVFRGG